MRNAGSSVSARVCVYLSRLVGSAPYVSREGAFVCGEGGCVEVNLPQMACEWRIRSSCLFWLGTRLKSERLADGRVAMAQAR
jgi:hypothetical protein